MPSAVALASQNFKLDMDSLVQLAVRMSRSSVDPRTVTVVYLSRDHNLGFMQC